MADLHLDYYDYKKLFRDREKRLQLINSLSFIPTVPYLKMVYRIKTGRKLDLRNPKNFAEKLNWLKVNDIHEDYTRYVDKYEMKKYISEKYGKEHVIPLLGAWKSFDSIDFNTLPKTFVLKCTHDSGSIRIIKDKNSEDLKELKRFFDNRLAINSYNLGREYPYKNVVPRIIAEEYYTTDDDQLISDCKFYCFDGVPKVMYIVSGRNANEKQNWYDMDFNQLDIIDPTSPISADQVEKPLCFEEMKAFAADLSKGMKFVRVDLFVDRDKYYFGEMTFFPFGGFIILKPEEWDLKLGNWINTDTPHGNIGGAFYEYRAR